MFQIYETTLLTETKQIRFPRCKSKRIRNKWKKDRRNFITFPSDKVYVYGNSVFAHPIMAARLKKSLLYQ